MKLLTVSVLSIRGNGDPNKDQEALSPCGRKRQPYHQRLQCRVAGYGGRNPTVDIPVHYNCDAAMYAL